MDSYHKTYNNFKANNKNTNKLTCRNPQLCSNKNCRSKRKKNQTTKLITKNDSKEKIRKTEVINDKQSKENQTNSKGKNICAKQEVIKMVMLCNEIENNNLPIINLTFWQAKNTRAS